MWDVLGFGAVAVDDLVYLDGYPLPDSKTPVCAEQREGGGLAGTALVAAARLGARAAYLGILGQDELSRFTIAELEREGVDCTHVRRAEGARPVHSTIIVDRCSGQRTILYCMAGVTPMTRADLTADLLGATRVLFVDSTMAPAALYALDLARAQHIPVVADLEHAHREGVLELARGVDHLIVGSDFAAQATGESDPAEMVLALRSPLHTACVVTAGSRGCWYTSRQLGDGVHHTPACQVQVVDTTGCGDVFHGAYAASIARGDGVARAIAIATTAAGLKATQPGGRRGIPDRNTLERFLREQDASGLTKDEGYPY
jgi:sulfofructose kinase